MRGDWYQLSLIFLGVLVTVLLGAFFYRELFPEYKIYQNAYARLEEFRSSYAGSPPPPFTSGIKQILIDKGYGAPPIVDRCTSCHVALELPHFSPTKIATDINGSPMYNVHGDLILESNEEYIWTKLDQTIERLRAEGKVKEADHFLSWKTVEVGDFIYDMTKVLRAHPLIGKETRPFQFHPIEEYGCTVCHNGNGRALTTDKAHGPIFDGQYEKESTGPSPQFLEKDVDNDPSFANIFNHKPGHKLLFQTNPLFVGALIQSNCVQCHSSAKMRLEESAKEVESVKTGREEIHHAIEKAFLNEKKAIESLIRLNRSLREMGYAETKKEVKKNAADLTLPQEEMTSAAAQLVFLDRQKDQNTSLYEIQKEIGKKVGEKLKNEALVFKGTSFQSFLEKHAKDEEMQGTLFEKWKALKKDAFHIQKIQRVEIPLQEMVQDKKSAASSIDFLIENYHQGESLFFSQGCYACHRIDGLSRGGVGPELTNEGEKYPWFIKESIVWPQADLKTSVMPNFRLDHSEIENLMTFLLAQRGRERKTSEISYKTKLLEWEGGARLPWEQPINPGKLDDVRYGMTIFATEGCASCHRLKGYTSDVGYAVEKENSPSFETLYHESQWFQKLIPEEISALELVGALEKHGEELDARIVDHVRSGSILEEIERQYPSLIKSFNAIFPFAHRAKNHFYKQMASETEDIAVKEQAALEQKKWQDRVQRVLMMYVQEYGLGRLIGPRPNWSGIYRSDEWLIEHFRKPSRHTAKSIMPVMPFDDSKFYLLTYMLDALAQKNREGVRQIWEERGFDPEQAYHIHCSQCHGDYLHGNGPVAQWIYPIPKNLRNAAFLRNLTRENVVNSILHGVKGTPMPPWGEIAQDKLHIPEKPVLTEQEAVQIVDWLFSFLLGGTVIRSDADVDKWRYSPEDAIKELEAEGNELKSGPPAEILEFEEIDPRVLNMGPVLGETLSKKQEKLTIEEVFEIAPNPIQESEKFVYHIKNKYYTKENLLAGQKFFELNCAVCHGKEADGQGYRAGTMYDAKPRMLTNLHWVDTRDDLRLLRSIKYGVPGTSMTPWGDQTSSLQRLQLVMFLRSLNKEQEERDALFNAIYSVYDLSDQRIEMIRLEEYAKMEKVENQLKQLRNEEKILNALKEQGETELNERLSLYKKRLELKPLLKKSQKTDQLLLELKEAVKQEGKIYQNLGILLVGKPALEIVFKHYLEMIGQDSYYAVDDHKLIFQQDREREERRDQIIQLMIQRIQKEIKFIEMKLETVQEGASKETQENLDDLTLGVKSLYSFKNALISGHEEAKRQRLRQQKIYDNYVSHNNI